MSPWHGHRDIEGVIRTVVEHVAIAGELEEDALKRLLADLHARYKAS